MKQIVLLALALAIVIGSIACVEVAGVTRSAHHNSFAYQTGITN